MHEAFPLLVQRITEGAPVLERLAMARLDQGFDVYGDATFTRAAERIERELDEELADALVYTCSLLFRRYGGDA